MKIIPSEKVEFKTTLSVTEVDNKLRENIQPKRGGRLGFSKKEKDKVFEGNHTNRKFEIQRVIYHRNSFLPQIKGSYQSTVNGTKVIAELKLHGFVVVFMIFWLSGVSLALIATIIGIITQETNPIAIIIPLIMLAFGFGLSHYGFYMEKEKSINELKKVLK
ncbi:hypothetical protein [Tenacibaculum sp.]|uniref:hypothetical protein n=1 Tax=Tenacibaculum sp. TaxID=1906242 RepID=UPI003D0F298B